MNLSYVGTLIPANLPLEISTAFRMHLFHSSVRDASTFPVRTRSH